MELTAYGKLVPTGTAGKHSYEFQFPDSSEKHKAKEYAPRVAKDDQKVTSGNIFQRFALRNGLLGVCCPLWRLQHDPVRHFLVTRKPSMTVAEDVALDKGRPKKVMWVASP